MSGRRRRRQDERQVERCPVCGVFFAAVLVERKDTKGCPFCAFEDAMDREWDRRG